MPAKVVTSESCLGCSGAQSAVPLAGAGLAAGAAEVAPGIQEAEERLWAQPWEWQPLRKL